jgi:hypothetical protein
MFSFLLDRGADLNHRFDDDGATVWSRILSVMFTSCSFIFQSYGHFERSLKPWHDWLPIVRKMIMEHGAPIDMAAVDQVVSNMAKTMHPNMLNPNRMYVVLECISQGKDELAFDYLSGRKDVGTFQSSSSRRSRHS